MSDRPGERRRCGHTHRPPGGTPHFVTDERITLSSDVDHTDVLWAVALPDRRFYRVERDGAVRSGCGASGAVRREERTEDRPSTKSRGVGVLSDAAFPAWPFEKIERNLGKTPRGRRCVLLATGALNPVHLGHVAMFDEAARTLGSDCGLEVVGGFLTPSHDLYVQQKHGNRGAKTFTAAQRLQMCAAATRDHAFLAVGAWESSVRGRWPDFPEVVAELDRALRDRFPKDPLLVLYLCGEDRSATGTRCWRPCA